VESTDKFLADPFFHRKDEYLGRKLTEDEAVEEAMGLAFAGSGTTATTILYILYHLSRPDNRTMQLRLREELLSSGTKVADLAELKYLNAVIKETMRLNPSLIGTLPRILTTAVETDQGKNKLVFPPGTLISMQNYVHHRDPNVYPEPHTFNPDRWIGVSQSTAVEKAFTPYSLGPRNCIGQNLANLEIRLAVSHLFRQLDFRLNAEMKEGDMEMEDRFAALTRGGRLVLDVAQL
jgi:cytochrome P450